MMSTKKKFCLSIFKFFSLRYSHFEHPWTSLEGKKLDAVYGGGR